MIAYLFDPCLIYDNDFGREEMAVEGSDFWSYLRICDSYASNK